jgi:hypothetical protein
MARIVDARVDRREIMVEDPRGKIWNADVVSRYQTLASGKDETQRTEMLVEQSTTLEDGRSLQARGDGTFVATGAGEVFRLVPDPDGAT